MDRQFKHIHTQQIDAISGGDNNFKIELVNIFLEQIPEFVTSMNNALQKEDWVLLARESHTAKSSALTFGMENTGQLLKKIQNLSEAEDTLSLSELVGQACGQLQAAVTELEDLKRSL